MSAHAHWARLAGAVLATAALGCAPSQEQAPPKNTLVLGIDVSGSFRAVSYDDAIEFAAYYLYGHLNSMGELRPPTAVFVGSVGGERLGEVKAFHPIHDLRGKSVEELVADLREWFPPEDQLTEFNAFFERTSTLVKRQNLILAPLNIVILSDGVPDIARGVRANSETPYAQLDLAPLEYLSRSVTVRLLYPTPTVAVRWEQNVERRRVRLWTVDREVMAGWRDQVTSAFPADSQDELWTWIKDIVDFRVRARIL